MLRRRQCRSRTEICEIQQFDNHVLLRGADLSGWFRGTPIGEDCGSFVRFTRRVRSDHHDRHGLCLRRRRLLLCRSIHERRQPAGHYELHGDVPGGCFAHQVRGDAKRAEPVASERLCSRSRRHDTCGEGEHDMRRAFTAGGIAIRIVAGFLFGGIITAYGNPLRRTHHHRRLWRESETS